MADAYVCKVLIVDDRDVLSLLPRAELPDVRLTQVRTVEQALALIDSRLSPLAAVFDIASELEHDFDIVLLDWDLGEEQMAHYPLGGLSLQTLFQSCYAKTWPCLVIGYSDKLQRTMNRFHWLLNLVEARARGRGPKQQQLFTSAIRDIPWKSIFEERAMRILLRMPSNVAQELMATLEEIPKGAALANAPLPQLASFLNVSEITLAQLFHNDTMDGDALWLRLNPVFEQGSRCRSLYTLYHEKPIHDVAHLKEVHASFESKGVLLDAATNTVRVPDRDPGRAGESTAADMRPYIVPSEFLAALQDIENRHRGDTSRKQFAQRTVEVHQAFRYSVRGAQDNGYLLPEWPAPTMKESVALFAYIPRPILEQLLRDLHAQARGPRVQRFGPDVSPDNRWITFYFRQPDVPIRADDVRRIANSIRHKKTWGPFPEVLRWGVVCATDNKGSCSCVWPGGVCDVPAQNAPESSLGLRIPLHE